MNRGDREEQANSMDTVDQPDGGLKNADSLTPLAQPIRGHFSTRATAPYMMKFSHLNRQVVQGHLAHLWQKHSILKAADNGSGPIVTVLSARTTLVVSTVDEFSGSLAVGLKSTEDTVVDLAKQDLAAVCTRWVVTRQVHSPYHPRLIEPGEIRRHLDC